MHIAAYMPGYALEIAHVFSRSVHSIDEAFYTKEQKHAWAPLPPNHLHWNFWCENEKPLLAFDGEVLVGFMSLNEKGYIDRAFVDPKAQGKGTGMALLARVESIARVLNFPKLHTHASVVARPFFEKNGFKVIQENSICRGKAQLTNYTMEKKLCG